MKWLSTREFAELISDHFPANTSAVRQWCEEGLIPPEFAKRMPGKERPRWFISPKGILYILRSVLGLNESEIMEVQAKRGVNFSWLAA